MHKISKPKSKGLYVSAIVTGIVALCCFTPLLVIVLVGIGLTVLVPYLDYVLFPALGLSIIFTIYFYKKWKDDCKKCK
jgi:mercuric ion transport protein